MSASAGPRWIRWRRVVGRAALGLALAGTLHLTAAIVDGLGDAGGVADVAVVLGNHVNEDGTPSRRLALRLAAFHERADALDDLAGGLGLVVTARFLDRIGKWC